eukprot:Rhum_TRINITY_DN15079_c14_g1::Rhum_TRINITY_DN15079_c14_g1_i1::g.136991::m.136991
MGDATVGGESGGGSAALRDSSGMYPRFKDIDEQQLRQCYAMVSSADTFEEFRERLVNGSVATYRAAEIKQVLRHLLLNVYRTYDVSVNYKACKGDLVRQFESIRSSAALATPVISPTVDPNVDADGAAAPAASPVATTSAAAAAPPAAKPASPLLSPEAVPDITLATHDALRVKLKAHASTWSPQSIFRHLESDKQLSGHQQLQYPTIRWLGDESIAILRAADTAVKTRLQLKLTLSQSEHALVTNARKRPYCLHLVCLRRDSLYPAQWPDGLTVRADGKPAAVPHASWRNKDESRDWCRVVSPVDLTACVSPLNRTLYVTVESAKVHQSVVIAVCLVENKGITAVCEEVKERIVREHEERVRRRASAAAAAGTETLLTPPLARDAGCEEEICVDRTTVALYDPVTMTRVQYPVKGQRCSHPGAFDLFTYIHFCCSSRMWVCPECEEPCGPTHSLQYDAYFHDVLQSEQVAADPDATHVVMHADGTWVLKPVEPVAGAAGGGGGGGG